MDKICYQKSTRFRTMNLNSSRRTSCKARYKLSTSSFIRYPWLSFFLLCSSIPPLPQVTIAFCQSSDLLPAWVRPALLDVEGGQCYPEDQRYLSSATCSVQAMIHTHTHPPSLLHSFTFSLNTKGQSLKVSNYARCMYIQVHCSPLKS